MIRPTPWLESERESRSADPQRNFAPASGREPLRAGADPGGDELLTAYGRIRLVGTAGSDFLRGTGGADRIHGRGGNDRLDGRGGNDDLRGGSGRDTLLGRAGKDKLDGGGSNDTIKGGGGKDMLLGRAGNDVLDGGGGNDKIRGGGGRDSLLGRAGNDDLDGGGGNDKLSGGAGRDTLSGRTGRDRLEGGGGDDTLAGGARSDILSGGAGNDRLDGGGGSDSLRGGPGNDLYVIDSGSEIARALPDAGVDTVRSTVSYALGAHQEHLVLLGTGTLIGTGNHKSNRIIGNAGANTLDGGAGIDTLVGGAGNDVYVIDHAGEIGRSTPDPGIDSVRSTVSYVLGAHQEHLTLVGTGASSGTGNAKPNRIIGNAGANVLDGRGGIDLLAGGSGNDTYVIDGVNEIDRSVADPGSDTVRSSVSYTLGAGQEHLILTGSGALSATGNDKANTIEGNAGSNVLDGAGGADVLDGGAGADAVAGGAGDDVIVFDPNDTSADGGGGEDTLRITGSGVSLDLSTTGAGALVAIEVIDLGAGGNNVLHLDPSSLVGASSDTHTLRVIGGADDRLRATGTWTRVGSVDIGAGTFIEYTSAGATLHVQSGLDHQVQVPAIDLAALDGSDGLRLVGVDAGDASGRSVSGAGDVNGDGFDDLLIGAPGAAGNGNAASGETYVVFGASGGFASDIDLSGLDGGTGFRLDGVAGDDASGTWVSGAGDVNGDGFDDLVIGAFGADPGGDANAGVAYVLFGAASGFASSIDLVGLDGTSGFRLEGVDPNDRGGRSVSGAGDVNGDGFEDLLIGAYGAAPGGDAYAGESYVVFGASGAFASSIDLGTLNGSDGMRLDGIDVADLSGRAVSGAGDVNGDGLGDLLIGANGAGSSAGEIYVVFGTTAGFASTVDLAGLDGTTGYRIDGIDGGDLAGGSVSSAGDVNGDGFADVIIGAWGAAPGDNASAGESYVVFGASGGFASVLGLGSLDGSNGFRLNGVDATDLGGRSVSGAGDVNGDGYHDLLIGASQGDPGGNSNAGESYLLFGASAGFASSIDLAGLDGNSGIRLDGIDAGDYSGRSVSAAGDVDGDGFDDIVIGAWGADQGTDTDVGESYLLFGRDFTSVVDQTGTAANDDLAGTAGDEILIGGRGDDSLDGGSGVDVLRGGAGDDHFIHDATDRQVDGGTGSDTLYLVGAGDTLDLTVLTAHRISGIETLDLTGTGDNHVVLDWLDVLHLPDSGNALRIIGNAGDTVNASGTWADGGETGGARTWTQGSATLLVDDDVGFIV